MRICLDHQKYKVKPHKSDVKALTLRIAREAVQVNDIRSMAESIGHYGQSWCPATFISGKRSVDTFEQIQFFALDFDGGVSWDEIHSKSLQYNIPILFAYETFSSVDCNKFRVVFLNDISINQKRVADVIIQSLMTVFDHCDKQCKDVSRMFLEAKTSSIIVSNENGKKSPKYYLINFGSVSKLRREKRKSHKLCRSDMIDVIKGQCRLFREFESGDEWLYYNQLCGLAMNLLHIEKGKDCFLNIVENSEHSSYREKDWPFYLSYFYKKGYLPQNCDSFCPYEGECKHSTNIIETAKVKYHEIFKINNADEDYCELHEAGFDLKNQFSIATDACDNRIHVVKAQTAIGKTKLYLAYIKQSDKPCLIAVPTNKLKNQVYDRACSLGINTKKTPSVLEFVDELPEEIRCAIQSFFNSGRNHIITRYIASIIETRNSPILSRYLQDKSALKAFNGHIITTHHYLMMQSYEYLKSFTIIIDEDILQTIIRNQGMVSIRDLFSTLQAKEKFPISVRHKIVQATSYCDKKDFFTLSGFNYDNDNDVSFDLSAFIRAEKFYSDGEYIYFFKKVGLERLKYIVLSATADENIYKCFFGANRVMFHYCRQARYKGQLIQYYDKTMSRAFIKANQDIYDIIRDRFGNSRPMISFKGSAYCSDLHFGNTEGCDHMKGKDIIVAGTPHIAEFVYKLFAYHMGFEITKDDKLQYQKVIHGGYSYWFYTYKKEILRDIQFWLIEGELEQSVGRARLLRNNCSVILFSNFPLPQAQLKLWESLESANVAKL